LVALTVDVVPGLVDELEQPETRREVAAKEARPKQILANVDTVFFIIGNK